ncbi:hypothetical protein [Roseateles amylovorans]|uniref:Uncharacterized protein n=1 Tax=Roseateles amylovorans TaxID=2978473 RepID=A0ABY6B5S5_9BURK|nr:hypothetical protein [Roseateles amylovorans]UXH78888.1 hypothetical protein N4261_02800 [Roseateles amylovorans]
MSWTLPGFTPTFLQRGGTAADPSAGPSADPPSGATAGHRSPPDVMNVPNVPGAPVPTTPVRYNPARHGTVARFRVSDSFPLFRDELHQHMQQLRNFANRHLSQAAALAVFTDLSCLYGRIMDFDILGRHRQWGPQAGDFFNHGQDLLALFVRRVTDERVDLVPRLTALQETTPRLTLCLDGVLLALQEACIALDRSRTGLAATADLAMEALLTQIIVTEVERLHEWTLRMAPGSQVHLVSGLRHALYPAMGRPPPADRLAAPPDRQTLEQVRLEVQHRLVPGRLAEHLAENYLQRWRDSFLSELPEASRPSSEPWRWNDDMDRAAAAADAILSPEFGQVPRHGVLDLDEDDDGVMWARPLRDPAMVGRHLLNELRRLDVIADESHPRTITQMLVPHPLIPGRQTLLSVMHQDEVLAWAEEAGTARPLRPADLASWADANVHARLPSNAARAAVNAALRCPNPAELVQMPSCSLLDEAAQCEQLCSRLTDEALQGLLSAWRLPLDGVRSRWFLNAFIAQHRVALLAPDQVRGWTTLSENHITGEMVRLAMQQDSAELMRAVGTLIEQIRNRSHVSFTGILWRHVCLLPPDLPGPRGAFTSAIQAGRGQVLSAYVQMIAELRHDRPLSPATPRTQPPQILPPADMVSLLRQFLRLAAMCSSPASLRGLIDGIVQALHNGAMSARECRQALDLGEPAADDSRLADLLERRGAAHLAAFQEGLARLSNPPPGSLMNVTTYDASD